MRVLRLFRRIEILCVLFYFTFNFIPLSPVQSQSTIQAKKLWQYGNGVIYDFDWAGQNLILATSTGIWSSDAAFSQPAVRLDQGEALAQTVRISTDGTRFATYDGDAHLRIWDIQTGKVLLSVPYSGTRVMAWQPQGFLLALLDLQGKQNLVTLLDSRTGKQIETVGSYDETVVALGWQQEGTLLAVGLADGRIVIEDIVQHKRLHLLASGFLNMSALVWSPDGHKLAAAGNGDSPVNVWQTDTFDLISDAASPHFVIALAWSGDSNQLAGALVGGNVDVWNLTTRELTSFLPASNTTPSNLAERVVWHGDQMATLDRSHRVRVWDMVKHGVVGESTLFTDFLNRLAVSPDGKLVALSYKNSPEVLVLDAVTGMLKQTLTAPRPLDSTDLAWSPSGKQLAVSSASLFLWQFQPGASEAPIQVDDVDLFSWSPNDQLAVMSQNGNIVRFIDGKTGKLLPQTQQVDSLMDLLWSRDGRWLALYKYNPPGDAVQVPPFQIDVWDVQNDVTQIVNLPYAGEFRMTPYENFRWLADSSGLIGFTGAGKLWRWHKDAEAEIVIPGGSVEPSNPPFPIWLELNVQGDLLAVSDPVVGHMEILDATNGQSLLSLDGFASLPYLFEWGVNDKLFVYDGVVHSYQIKRG